MERKLVSVQRIDQIEPIAGADNIVKARVMGWDVVVKKSEFQPGDLCVFFEIDSVLPADAPWAEFMRPRGFRVKTVRLRGVLSQGLALPLSILPGGAVAADVPPIGTDIRELLGVVKHEPILPDTRELAGAFPGAVPKTDEIRLQSSLGVLDEIRGRDFYVTTKLDGTSTTFARIAEGELIACSRNWALARGPNQVWRIAERHELDRKLPPDFAVQGELCGPGIQKNRLGLSQIEWFVFSAYNIREGRYLGLRELVALCEHLGVKTVPVERVFEGQDAAEFEHSLARYLQMAAGLYPGTKNRKEGIVVRPLVEVPSPTLQGRLSFKIINNEFLLKDED